MIKIEISYRGMILLLSTVFIVWALLQLWSVLLLVLISLILMIGLLPYVEGLVRMGLSRTAAVLLLTFAVLLAVFGAFSLMVPALIREFRDLQDNLPNTAREVEELLAGFGMNVQLQDRARNIDWGGIISGRAAVDYGQRLLTTTLSVITIIVMTAYLLADTPRLARFIGQFIPETRKDEANSLFVSISRVVGGYLRGQVITSLCIAVYTFVLLRIVGVPNALAYAVLAAFADVVPLVGAFIATIPPVIAALETSSTRALIVLGGLLAYQQFEDRILVPRVYGATLNLPPIIVLFAVLAGAELMGVTGVLLALPLTAAARVGLDYVIEHRRLPLTQDNETEGSDIEQPLAPDIDGTSELARAVENPAPETRKRRSLRDRFRRAPENPPA